MKKLYEDEGIDLDNFSIEEEIKKYKGYKPQGWKVAVRLFTNHKKTSGGIILTDNHHDEQQYHNCVGLVVAMSKAAYLDPRYDKTGDWCKIGDWIEFPRHAGTKINYKGLPTFTFQEDAVIAVVDDPRDITR